VGLGGAGKCQRSPNPLGSWGISAARLPSPATRDNPFATRLATLLFYFCSYSRDSAARVKPATRDRRLCP
jgi:hypothetical protein